MLCMKRRAFKSQRKSPHRTMNNPIERVARRKMRVDGIPSTYDRCFVQVPPAIPSTPNQHRGPAHAATFASAIDSKNKLYDTQRCRSDRRIHSQGGSVLSGPEYPEVSRRFLIPDTNHPPSSSAPFTVTTTRSDTTSITTTAPAFEEHLPSSHQGSDADGPTQRATQLWPFSICLTHTDWHLGRVVREFLLRFLARLLIELLFKFQGG